MHVHECVCVFFFYWIFAQNWLEARKRDAAFDLKMLHACKFIEKQYLCLLVGINRFSFSYPRKRERGRTNDHRKDRIPCHWRWKHPLLWTNSERPRLSAMGFENLMRFISPVVCRSSSIRLELRHCQRLDDRWRACTLLSLWRLLCTRERCCPSATEASSSDWSFSTSACGYAITRKTATNSIRDQKRSFKESFSSSRTITRSFLVFFSEFR